MFDSATPWSAAHQTSLSITNMQESTQTRVHWFGDVTQPSHPLFLLHSVFPSIRFFSNESALCIRWLKHWSFSFSVSLCNEYSGLISFSTDWFDLLAPWLKSINYLALSLLYGPTFTSVHDYWKSHSFLLGCLGFSLLSFQGASTFEFHVYSLCPQTDFGA